VSVNKNRQKVPQLGRDFFNSFLTPFSFGLCFWQRLLESPHEPLPSLHLRDFAGGPGFLFKRKAFTYFHIMNISVPTG
jgi:hypothetical protein